MKLFSDFLNKVRVGNIDGNVGKILKAIFMHKSYESYSRDVLKKYKKNESAMKRKEAVVKDLRGELYIIEANDKIPYNCK